jgi:hypothetical protein
MTEEHERMMDNRYTLLTLAILERAYKDATQNRNKMLAWEAKRWISKYAWSLIELLDIPISEKEYLKWLSEIEPKKKGKMVQNDKRKWKNKRQAETDNRSITHLQDSGRSIGAGRRESNDLL